MQRCSIKKRVLTNFAKSTEKHLRQGLFFGKVASLRPATLLKKRIWHRCFLVNFAKFLNTPFLIEHLWWLLLKAIATLFSTGKASRNRVSCFSSLFLIKVKVSINVSGVMRISALNCCPIAIWFLLFHICWNHNFLDKRSKPFFQLSNQWSTMQYSNFVSKKIFFQQYPFTDYCFCGVSDNY